jgi:hypothetical protein
VWFFQSRVCGADELDVWGSGRRLESEMSASGAPCGGLCSERMYCVVGSGFKRVGAGRCAGMEVRRGWSRVRTWLLRAPCPLFKPGAGKHGASLSGTRRSARDPGSPLQGRDPVSHRVRRRSARPAGLPGRRLRHRDQTRSRVSPCDSPRS